MTPEGLSTVAQASLPLSCIYGCFPLFALFLRPLLSNTTLLLLAGTGFQAGAESLFRPNPPFFPQLSRVMGRMVLGQQTHGITESWTCHPTRPVPVDCFPRRCLHYGHRPSLSVSSPCVYNFILSPGWCCVTISSPLIGAVGSGSFPPCGLQLQTAIDRI